MPSATIEVIESIKPHKNADALELAQILGFQCVVPIGKYSAGEKVIYIHPDSVLPSDKEWANPFLKYAPKRTKAVKLRGEWSEGIIVDLKALEESSENLPEPEIGFDCSELLGVSHYVASMKNSSDIGVIGGLPYSIPKTDESRWEVKRKKLPFGDLVDVTLKVDGQSWSAYYNHKNDEFGVLGRRMAFEIESDNSYTRLVKKYNLKEKLKNYCVENQVSLCIRGESYGGGIQNMKCNPHSNMDHNLALFSVYLIEEHRYTNKNEPHHYINVGKALEIPTVDIVEEQVPLSQELINKYSKDLKKLNGQYFEGVVIKGNNFSFKVINKHYDSLK